MNLKQLPLIKEMKLQDNTVFPAGTRADVGFNTADTKAYLTFAGRETPVRISAARLNVYFKGFKKEPSTKTLEKYMSEGICPTVTGEKVEPDGRGSDSSPSWLLALGLI